MFRSPDARPDPRFSSQMQDIFSSEWGVQQDLLAYKLEQEAEQLENTRRANIEITVHAQLKVKHYFNGSLSTMLM